MGDHTGILSVIIYVALNINTMEHYCTGWVWGSVINTVSQILNQGGVGKNMKGSMYYSVFLIYACILLYEGYIRILQSIINNPLWPFWNISNCEFMPYLS